MKVRRRLLCGIISALMLLSSCQSVYVDVDTPNETSGIVEVDTEKEYFTTGYLRQEVSIYDGFLYGDSWIYVEYNQYDKYSGDKFIMTQQVLRIVKANAHTGQVSSICVDPVCNHSPGSGCIAVAPLGVSMVLVQGVVGDWVMFQYSMRDRKNETFVSTNYVYNLKTGETFDLFVNDVESAVMTLWKSRCTVENKVYGVKNILDYTNTGYEPGKSNSSDYVPETKSILCVCDFETRATTELFEIPAGYTLTEVTNKRFILSDGTGKQFYTIDYNGENLTEMDVLDFSPSAVCGTYAYGTNSDREFMIYDLSTNTKKILKGEGVLDSCYVTPVGIVKKTVSDTEEYEKYNSGDMIYGLDEYIAEKQKEKPDWTSEDDSRWVREYTAMFQENKAKSLYKATTTLSLIKDMYAEGEAVPFFTMPNGVVSLMHATDKYLYCTPNVGDPNNDYKKVEYDATGYFIIDLETGESKEIPYLELIIPHEDRKPE